MIQNVISHIGGIGLYGIISVCLFFLVFVAVVIRVVLLKKTYVDRMRRLPLEDDSASSNLAHPSPSSRP